VKTDKQQLQYNISVGLLEQIMFQSMPKGRQQTVSVTVTEALVMRPY